MDVPGSLDLRGCYVGVLLMGHLFEEDVLFQLVPAEKFMEVLAYIQDHSSMNNSSDWRHVDHLFMDQIINRLWVGNIAGLDDYIGSENT